MTSTYTLLTEATKLLANVTPPTDRHGDESRADWGARLGADDALWWQEVDMWVDSCGDKLGGIHAVVEAAKGRQDVYRRQADVLQAAARREQMLQDRLKAMAVDLMRDARELASRQAGFDGGWREVCARLAAAELALLQAEGALRLNGSTAAAVDAVKAAKRGRNAAKKVKAQVSSTGLESGGKARIQANAPGLAVSVTDAAAVPPSVVKEIVLSKTSVKRYMDSHSGRCPGVHAEVTGGDHVRWSA